MDGDPIVRQIVNKLYGPGDEVLESVVIKESEVIVSRETLRILVRQADYADEHFDGSDAAIAEAREILGDA